MGALLNIFRREGDRSGRPQEQQSGPSRVTEQDRAVLVGLEAVLS